MGLSNFPCLAEGMLPVLLMNSVFSMALLKNILRSALQVIGANPDSEGFEIEIEEEDPFPETMRKKVLVTKFELLCGVETSNNINGVSGSGSGNGVECSVCLCVFEDDEEVSVLSCKHFFHTSCLDKWFHIKHSTCPLCRSVY